MILGAAYPERNSTDAPNNSADVVVEPGLVIEGDNRPLFFGLKKSDGKEDWCRTETCEDPFARFAGSM